MPVCDTCGKMGPIVELRRLPRSPDDPPVPGQVAPAGFHRRFRCKDKPACKERRRIQRLTKELGH